MAHFLSLSLIPNFSAPVVLAGMGQSSHRSLNTNATPSPPTKAYRDGFRNSKKNIRKAMGLLPPGLEPETFALPDTLIEVLVRRSNQLSYGSRPNVLETEIPIPAHNSPKLRR
jgi:hypothetical protein